VGVPSCRRCGSTVLRRARARTWWQQLVRELTSLHRYACGECHHRGWTFADVPYGDFPRAAGELALSPMPNRPLEERDVLAFRREHARRLGAVLLALMLGALLATVLAAALH
jgi:hypothetical protein